MIKRLALTLALTAFTTGLFFAGPAWADDVINVSPDDTAAQPAPKAKPATKAAPADKGDEAINVDNAEAADEAEPTPVPQAVPAKAQPPAPPPQPGPTVIPSKAMPAKAAPTKAVTPKPTPAPKPAVEEDLEPGATPVAKEDTSSDTDDDESSIHRDLRRMGLLDHPLLISTADVTGAYGFGSGASNYSLGAGFGIALRAELEIFYWLSLGVYYDLSVFPAPGRLVFAGPLGFMGRISPLRNTGQITPYLIGGLGLNTTEKANAPQYPGNFNGFAGVGAKVALRDKWDLDLGLVYNYYSPQNNPFGTVTARVGLSYEYGL